MRLQDQGTVRATTGAPGRRVVGHYISTAVLMSIYGGQVCPFLDDLTPVQLVSPLILMLAVQYVARGPLHKRWVDRAQPEAWTQRTFVLELCLFAVSGVAVALFNGMFYEFDMFSDTMISGAKVIIGFIGLGFFAATDIALSRELNLAEHLAKTGTHLPIQDGYFPMSRKMGAFASASAILTVGVFFLLINKDLDWLVETGGAVPLAQAQQIILAEFAFVMGVFLIHILNIVNAYARNLRFFFTCQTQVLARATTGDLTGRVPISTRDEFGTMASHTNVMIEGLHRRTEDLQRTQDVTIHSLASLAETRDNETGAHILRTQNYIKALAEQLSTKPGFRDHLDDTTITLLFKSAPLHDIGKVGIPDHILLKPGKLTDDEFAIMKTHTTQGSDALCETDGCMDTTSFLRLAKEIALTHHEKWDGSGYPRALKGDAIPLSGRLMAVADVYDALITKRVYKPAFSHAKAMEIIRDGRGGHFDPDIVDAFIEIEKTIIEISHKFADDAQQISN